MLFDKFFIFLYFFYSIYGYNFLTRLYFYKNIDYANFNIISYSFIGKRLLMLSHLTFLYTSFYLNYPSQNRFINTIILHLFVNIGYFINWGINDIITFVSHIYWSLVFFIFNHYFFYNHYFYKHFFDLKNDYINYLDYENYFILIFLLFYSNYYKFIYTNRIIGIDNNY